MVYLDFTSALYYLDMYGLTDLVLPFLLIFTIAFAVLQQIGLFEDRKYNAVIALTLSLLTVIPHVTGRYPAGYDVIEIINRFLPNALLVIVSLFIFLVLISSVSSKQTAKESPIVSLLAFLAVIALIFVFFASFTPTLPYWLSGLFDSTTLSFLLMLLVAVVVIWFITRPGTERDASGAATGDSAVKKMHKVLGELFSGDKIE